MGTSLLVVLLGMLVPVLAAAPFYVAQSQREQAEDREYAERLRRKAAAAEHVLPQQRTESDFSDHSCESDGPTERIEPIELTEQIEFGGQPSTRA